MAKQEKTSAELYREQRKARIAKAAKKKNSYNPQAAQKAGKVISIIFALAVVAGLAFFGVSFSGLVERSRIAVQIGDVKVSQAEYSYYYNSVTNMIMQYASYGIGFDMSVAPDKQEYNGTLGAIADFPEDQTPTWADYIEHNTINNLRYIKGFVKVANEKNITLTDEDIAEIEASLEEIKTSAKENGYSISGYYNSNCGKGVNEKIARKALEEQRLAQKVEEAKTKELESSYKDSAIEKEYKKNVNNYATVSFLKYKIVAEKVKAEDGSESADEKTLAKAKKAAKAFAEKATSVEAFKALASENEKAIGNKDYALYLTEDRATLNKDITMANLSSIESDTEFSGWAFNAKTAAGETKVVDGTDGSSIYMMVEPSHKAADSKTYDSRHILVNFINDEEKKEDVKVQDLDLSAYKDVNVTIGVKAADAKNKAAYAKALEILKKYLDGDKTEDAFAALATEHSEDTGSQSKGGLYEKTALGDFVKPYESFCTEKGRKAGDIALVEVESSNYSGYHIIYFIKDEVTTWKDTVKAALAQNDLTAYQDEIAKGKNVEASAKNEKALDAVEDFTTKLLKNVARQQSQQQQLGY